MMGPLMVNVEGTQLTTADKHILQHPLIGGVIFFTRNYESPEQLKALTTEIKAINSSLLLAVDQEGGRVQRFRDGFTELPPMGELGTLFHKNPDMAKQLAETTGWVLASELLAAGIDLSFTPDLDCNLGLNEVIGNRGFDANPHVIVELSTALIRGLNAAGMQAVGKHFPGHGSVNVDSHDVLPVDRRSYEEVAERDLIPFQHFIKSGIAGIMPAHIVFPEVDVLPTSCSAKWLQDILRQKLGFEGAIFSDDMSMGAAVAVGGITERVQLALDAGCDMVLVCNDRAAVETLLTELPPQQANESRLAPFKATRQHTMAEIKAQPEWARHHELIKRM